MLQAIYRMNEPASVSSFRMTPQIVYRALDHLESLGLLNSQWTANGEEVQWVISAKGCEFVSPRSVKGVR